MAKAHGNWFYFFLLRCAAVLKRKLHNQHSIMTKMQFVNARIAARLCFFTAGLATSPWACMMPYVKTRLSLNDMHYASLVLCYGLGAVIGMPLTGRLAARFGVRPILALACLGALCGMSGISSESLTLPIAYGCVLLWGMSLGIFDVGNNIHGACIEEMAGRHLMSSFHAFYTVGCIASAVYCALMLHLGLHTLYVALLLTAVSGMLLIYFYPKLINTHGEGATDSVTEEPPVETKRRTLIPAYLTSSVLFISVICLIMYLAEGMIYDWSAVYLIEHASVSITIASVGYLAFESAVALMRFKGDAIVTKAGPVKLIVGGGIIGCISIICIALSTNPFVIVPLFFISGLALANVVPVMLSHTAKITGKDQGRALSFVGTWGYGGLLLGPGILGAIATIFGLPGMFIFTGCLVFILGLMALHVLRAHV